MSAPIKISIDTLIKLRKNCDANVCLIHPNEEPLSESCLTMPQLTMLLHWQREKLIEARGVMKVLDLRAAYKSVTQFLDETEDQ
jgi:hypothetical protein